MKVERHLSIDNVEWSVRRLPGGWAGVVDEDQLPQTPHRPLIIFHGPSDQRRTLELQPGAPSLEQLSDDDLTDLFARAV